MPCSNITNSNIINHLFIRHLFLHGDLSTLSHGLIHKYRCQNTLVTILLNVQYAYRWDLSGLSKPMYLDLYEICFDIF